MFASRIIGCSLLVLVAASLGQAASVTLSPSKDNSMFSEGGQDLSSGVGQYLFAGTNSRQPTIRRALVEFDVAAAIPAGATITSATLTLNMSRTDGTPATIGIYRAASEWGQGISDAGLGGQGAAAATGDATWVYTFFNSTTWTAQGGDFSPAASSSVPIIATGFYSWGSTAAMVNDVQAWLDSPADNHGWLLKNVFETVSGTAKRFDSRENIEVSNRPVLTVEFSVVPEPGCLGLALMGGAGIAGIGGCRRRRLTQA